MRWRCGHRPPRRAARGSRRTAAALAVRCAVQRDHRRHARADAGRAVDGQRAAQRADTVREPLDARAAVERRAAHAVVAHLDRHTAVLARSRPRSPSRRSRACRCSRGTPTPRSTPPPRPRRAAARRDVATTSTGSVAREARSSSAAGSPRFVRIAGMDAAREVAQLLQREVGLLPRPADQLHRGRVAVRRRAARPCAGSARAPRAAAVRRRGGRARCAGARRPPRR